MSNVQNVTNDILWVGGSDRRLSLFENLFPMENGITYNAYLIRDEKTVLLDTVDTAVSRQFFENLEAALDGRPLDYLVVTHMEPDHCANIEELCRRWPGVKIVGNALTFRLIGQFFSIDMKDRTVEVKEGGQLALGRHNLQFFMAPMVHWPEVMFVWESTESILFSADAFGTFGGYAGNLFSDELDYENLYLDETRRYYTNIVGKFGPQVLSALKKLEGKTPRLICTLHGPVLRGADVAMLMEKYGYWAAYAPEKPGVVLAYASMYGNTEAAVQRLAALLSDGGVQDIRVYDTSKTHFSYIIADIFKYSHLVLASATYNMHIHNSMEVLARDIGALNIQNRDIAIIGNGSWAPMAHTLLEKMVTEDMKNMRLVAEPMLLRSRLTDEQDGEMALLAEKLAESIRARA